MVEMVANEVVSSQNVLIIASGRGLGTFEKFFV